MLTTQTAQEGSPNMAEVIETTLAGPPRTVANMTPAVVEQHSGLVRSAAQLSEVREAFSEYIALCDDLLVPDDYQQIGQKSFRKKSAWRKLAVAYSVSVQIVERIHEREGRHIIRTEVIARATAPNGRFMDGIGACDAFERCCDSGTCKRAQYNNHTCCDKLPHVCSGFEHFSKPNHDIPATAATRATNRACADLFGMGEVSAEEVTDDGEDHTPRARDRNRQGSRGQQRQTTNNEPPPDDDSGRPAPKAKPGLPNGWADWTACDAAHNAVAAQIKSLMEKTPEDARPEVRKPFDEHRDKYGWPMVPDALSALSAMVALATTPVPTSAPDAQNAPAAPDVPPETPQAQDAPAAGQSGRPKPTDGRLCPGCGENTLPSDPSKARPLRAADGETWHTDCYAKKDQDRPLCPWCEKDVQNGMPTVDLPSEGGTIAWHQECYDEWKEDPDLGRVQP